MSDRFKSARSWVCLKRLNEFPDPTVRLQKYLQGVGSMRSTIPELHCDERRYIGLIGEALTKAGFGVQVDPITYAVIAADEVEADLIRLAFPGIVVLVS